MKRFGMLVILYAILVFLHITFFNYIYDDAYIHFRIAENLVDNKVPFFNPKEAYMSSSSSIWTIFLALNYFLFGTIYIHIIPFFNSLFVISAIAFFLPVIEKHLDRKLTIKETLFFIITSIALMMPASIGLMETPMAIFFMALSLYLFSKDNILGFVFLSSSIFIRLEMAIFYLLFFVYFLIKDRNLLLKILTISIFTILPFIIYDLYFFKTLIPLTAIAKSKVYKLSTLGVFFHALPSVYSIHGKLLTFVLLIIIPILIYRERKEINLNLLIVVSASGFLLLLAYIKKKTLIFGWYVPLYSIPILLFLSYFSFHTRKRVYFLVVLLFFLPFYKQLGSTLFAAFSGNYAYYHSFKGGARVQKYIEISKIIYSKYPKTTLLTSEIGGLGYGFKGYILDGMGLIQPQCLKYHPMKVPEERSSGITGAIPVGCVKEYSPEIIISYDSFIEALRKDAILKKYQHYKLPVFTEEDLARTKEREIWGSKNLNVFIRNDIDNGI